MINYEEMRSSNGIMKTESLFYETLHGNMAKKYKPFYTLKEFEYMGLPSAYKIYMESTDEYEAAMKLLGSMAHWEKLCGLKWFMEGRDGVHRGLKSWREDIKRRDASTAKKTLIEKTKNDDTSAARALLAYSEDRNSKGRPKKKKEETQAIPEHLQNHIVSFNSKKRT